MIDAEPVLVDVDSAVDVVPGMTPTTVLTSGAPLEWSEYTGGQRQALIYGALFEGLATDDADAARRFSSGAITLGACHDHGCVGSVAGIYTASMPVLVVENANGGNRAYCNLYEGNARRRLTYGAYDDEVRRGLLFLQDVIGPRLGDIARRMGGIPLKPIIRRALHMGDELHSRNTAATLLFSRVVGNHLLELDGAPPPDLRRTMQFLEMSDYFFLRLSMASAKAAADAAHGVERSSLVTAMTLSCRDFAVRVSGLGDRWFCGPHPDVDAQLFAPFTPDDIAWIGGESCINETVGFGGFAQAAAFGLQAYQGGSAEAMARMNLAMYDITVAEHPVYQIPYFGFRGTPVGIDVRRVVETGIVPVIDAGLAGRDGGQIGAGVLRAPLEVFAAAAVALEEGLTRVAPER